MKGREVEADYPKTCDEVFMKKMLLAALAASTIVGAGAAEASGGCGPAFHRGPYGGCRPNRGPAYAAPGVPVIGVFYGGRGWWDGRRYWGHRYRWGRGWRYR